MKRKTLVFLIVIMICLTFAVSCVKRAENVTTENGIRYSANVSRNGKEYFSFVEKFWINLERGQFKEEFNAIKLVYSSKEPLHIFVTYSFLDGPRTDDYFLKSGEDVVFCGLISTYLERDVAKDVLSIRVDSCTGEETTFFLDSIFVERKEVFEQDTYYMENERFKVGIRLNWGGGINYVQDKECSVPGLTNLINDHDTGRLVQQSYYGTKGNEEYRPGRYNGSDWAYNPVQGGDVYGNPSRLIDVSFGNNYVYVKSQPQDWSLDNKLTRSYMENRYTLEDDHIKVDNVFTDFSGWEHDFSHQELPAFYTVSYLDEFIWYDGEEPWTNDGVSCRNDLNFWGDPAYAEDSRFILKEKNTESWCAWVSSVSDFGIGLYVPNVDMFYAGRFSYDGSKKSSADSTNYVAPLDTIKIVSYDSIEYSYLIATGSAETIRNVFAENKDFSDNSSLRKNNISMREKQE